MLLRLLRILICLVLITICRLAYPFQAELSTEVAGEFRPIIKGSTNLPDGTKLVIRIDRQQSAYRHEEAVEVQSGQFVVGPLSQRNGDLNPGIYTLEVVTISVAKQPDAVVEQFGAKGGKLQGHLVTKEAGELAVRYSTTFRLGQAENEELDKAARDTVKVSQTRWWKKQCGEICAGAGRYAGQKGTPFDNDGCLRTCIANPPSITR